MNYGIAGLLVFVSLYSTFVTYELSGLITFMKEEESRKLVAVEQCKYSVNQYLDTLVENKGGVLSPALSTSSSGSAILVKPDAL